jgi:hypothetical protein
MRPLFAMFALTACTDPGALGVTDLSGAEVDMNLANPAGGGNPGSVYLRGMDGALGSDVTASFDGLPGTISGPVVLAPQLPAGDALLMTLDDASDQAMMMIGEPFATRSASFDGPIMAGQSATILWSPATDAIDDAVVTCFDADRPVITAMQTATPPSGAIPLVVDGARMSFVVPDLQTTALTCHVAATAHPQIVQCTGLASCTAEVATPADIVVQATL